MQNLSRVFSLYGMNLKYIERFFWVGVVGKPLEITENKWNDWGVSWYQESDECLEPAHPKLITYSWGYSCYGKTLYWLPREAFFLQVLKSGMFLTFNNDDIWFWWKKEARSNYEIFLLAPAAALQCRWFKLLTSRLECKAQIHLHSFNI